MKLEDINLDTWFSTRHVHHHCPPHFTKTNTVLTPDALDCINEKTRGRYTILKNEKLSGENMYMEIRDIVAFEDSQEAVLFELTWS